MRRILRRTLIALFLTASAACAADYQVVLKSSGKVLHGEFVAEDANTITVNIENAEVRFKKDRLDLERMKTLNAQAAKEAAAKTPWRAPFQKVNGPFANRDLSPDQVQSIQQAYDYNLRDMSQKITNLNAVIAKYQSAPPSAERDLQLKLARAELARLTVQYQHLKLEGGLSEDPEANSAYKRYRDALDAEHRAERDYVAASGNPSTPKDKVEALFREMVRARQEVDKADEALRIITVRTH